LQGTPQEIRFHHFPGQGIAQLSNFLFQPLFSPFALRPFHLPPHLLSPVIELTAVHPQLICQALMLLAFHPAYDAALLFPTPTSILSSLHPILHSLLNGTLLLVSIYGVSPFMRQTIFVPSGMELTQDDDVHRLIWHRAQGYQKRKSGEIANSDLADTSYKIPGGGLISNAEEMARFEAALLNNMLLRPETRNRMWTTQTNQPTKKDPQRGYALGWGHSTWSGLATIGHAGAQQRVSTAIIMQPESKAGAVVLCNLEEVDVYELAAELLKVATGTSSP
jgi:hypothetical protein